MIYLIQQRRRWVSVHPLCSLQHLLFLCHLHILSLTGLLKPKSQLWRRLTSWPLSFLCLSHQPESLLFGKVMF
ncbi:hypothetical protein E2C01_091059 [Portunus trituberculatus]|uniref:Uncharacterized protein n=1 Tax=Portunus trituberculatus TaxID=210409 RepID=A0A5B7JD04_PORTR|nr:hypothetical protein [Portunus trituberculatus]